MTDKSAIRAEAARLQAIIGTNAEPIEADVLQPAETLLDLYGEDIRGRAYTTADPLLGERMLRPDFTVPVVQMHMARGADAARYCYSGEVFRRQERAEPGRPAEFIQVGLEVFGGPNLAERDADVFCALHEALAPLGLRAAMGDLGLIAAIVGGLKLSEARRGALLRHLWRPHRFRNLLSRFGGRRPVSATRAALLARLDTESPEAIAAEAGPAPGLRSTREIAARLAALKADAEEPDLPARDLQVVDEVLSVRAAPMDALAHLRDIAVDMPALDPALDRLARRFAALEARNVDLESVEFEASYGRTTLEYYDGFVFGLYAPDRPDLPPVASGGRYDALTRQLGKGREIPAVGGVIRPGLVLALGDGR